MHAEAWVGELADVELAIGKETVEAIVVGFVGSTVEVTGREVIVPHLVSSFFCCFLSHFDRPLTFSRCFKEL